MGKQYQLGLAGMNDAFVTFRSNSPYVGVETTRQVWELWGKPVRITITVETSADVQ